MINKHKPSTDIFGNAHRKVQRLNDNRHSVIVEMGNTPSETVIKTLSGEVIPMITSCNINVDADENIQTITMTLLQPLVIGKPPEKEIRDEKLAAAFSGGASPTEAYQKLVAGGKYNHVTVAKAYDDTGKPLEPSKAHIRSLGETMAMEHNIPVDVAIKIIQSARKDL